MHKAEQSMYSQIYVQTIPELSFKLNIHFHNLNLTYIFKEDVQILMKFS